MILSRRDSEIRQSMRKRVIRVCEIRLENISLPTSRRDEEERNCGKKGRDPCRRIWSTSRRKSRRLSPGNRRCWRTRHRPPVTNVTERRKGDGERRGRHDEIEEKVNERVKERTSKNEISFRIEKK